MCHFADPLCGVSRPEAPAILNSRIQNLDSLEPKLKRPTSRSPEACHHVNPLFQHAFATGIAPLPADRSSLASHPLSVPGLRRGCHREREATHRPLRTRRHLCHRSGTPLSQLISEKDLCIFYLSRLNVLFFAGPFRSNNGITDTLGQNTDFFLRHLVYRGREDLLARAYRQGHCFSRKPLR